MTIVTGDAQLEMDTAAVHNDETTTAALVVIRAVLPAARPLETMTTAIKEVEADT